MRNGDSTTAVRVIRATDELGGSTACLAATELEWIDAEIFTGLCLSMATAHESWQAIDQRRRATGDEIFLALTV